MNLAPSLELQPKRFTRRQLTNREMVNSERIGRRLRALRARSGFSQRTVAERMESKPSHVRKIEQGHHVPSLDWLVRFCDAVGASLLAVLSGGDKP